MGPEKKISFLKEASFQLASALSLFWEQRAAEQRGDVSSFEKVILWPVSKA